MGLGTGSKLALGMSDLRQEVERVPLAVQGSLPSWLQGTLFRNGPALFSSGTGAPVHWFDGLAMLHKFAFANGQLLYTNRFLQTPAYEKRLQTGNISGGFAGQASDPHGGYNANVSIARVEGRYLALTEIPHAVEFDPETLETVGLFQHEDGLPGQYTTAHPHYDFERRRLLNFTCEFGPKCAYHVFSIRDGQRKREMIGSIFIEEPSYMHSFAVTDHYVIFAEYPFLVNPLDLMKSEKSGIANFRWKPERGTRFYVMSKQVGAVTGVYESDAFFSFHHVNAYEDGGDIVVDLAAAQSAAEIGGLFADQLKEEKRKKRGYEFRRYRLPQGSRLAKVELLTEESIELPRIHYAQYNGKRYRYAYGVGQSRVFQEAGHNQLVKTDVEKAETMIWREDGCYPGEPVFVEKPQGTAEDDGVILSVVLDGNRGQSFLLMLDGQTFAEVARAYVPHHIPFGFHGVFER